MPERLEHAQRSPFLVYCGNCKYEWALCFLPMEITLFSKFGKGARCPMCGGLVIFVGSKPTLPLEGV